MKTIEELAREAGLVAPTDILLPNGTAGFTRFAALVAEQCAQIVERGGDSAPASDATLDARAVRAAFPALNGGACRAPGQGPMTIVTVSEVGTPGTVDSAISLLA